MIYDDDYDDEYDDDYDDDCHNVEKYIKEIIYKNVLLSVFFK